MPGVPVQQVTPDTFRQWKLQRDQKKEQASDQLSQTATSLRVVSLVDDLTQCRLGLRLNGNDKQTLTVAKSQ